MVIDTSALTAILRGESQRDDFLMAIATSPARLLSAVTRLEATMVLERRYGPEAGADLELLLYSSRARIVAFDAQQADIARSAWKKYGKGNHPAGLNLGDCCVYALAKLSGEPILCKGNDFPQTDIAIFETRSRPS
ncbi:MAG TPA: type II toxin-antitoxin system VapC family toxin [Bryobacterales bacterium]|nr:type II toxin-antitoxin system VapC family toxin [Bryobacterales bacterium]